jgi:hypothetical protein
MMVNNSTNINNDGQQFHQYQQPPLTSNQLTHKKWRANGNSGPGFG